MRGNTMKTEYITNSQTYTCVQALDKKLQELEIRINNMNYILLLEYTHSNEYYKRNQLFFRNSNKENGYHEEAL